LADQRVREVHLSFGKNPLEIRRMRWKIILRRK
jgi:hypothetical protein